MPLLQGNRGSEAASVVAVFGMLLFVVLMLVWMAAFFALLCYLPSAFIRLALTGEFGAGFAFRENLAMIRRNLGQYLLAVVIYMAAGLAASLGYLACCVGVFATSFWALCVLAWGLGALARRDPELSAIAARDVASAPPTS
jgi:hypothetical protein